MLQSRAFNQSPSPRARKTRGGWLFGATFLAAASALPAAAQPAPVSSGPARSAATAPTSPLAAKKALRNIAYAADMKLLAVARTGLPDPDAFFRLGDRAKPVIAYTEMCVREAFLCAGDDTASAPAVMALSDRRARELVRINAAVNKAVMPVTDQAHHGVFDHWSLPSDRYGRRPDPAKLTPGLMGDCEDYVLEKRQQLRALGWPRGSLTIAVVFDDRNEGHAVLIAITDRGMLSLDNKRDDILPWQETGYKFVKAQQPGQQNQWARVERMPAALSAGLRFNLLP